MDILKSHTCSSIPVPLANLMVEVALNTLYIDVIASIVVDMFYLDAHGVACEKHTSRAMI